MQKSNEDMGREELRQKIRQTKFEAEGLAVALGNMDSALDETGPKHWQQFRRSIEVMNDALKRLSPEIAALTDYVVKSAVDRRVAEGVPSELTYMMRTLLKTYMGLQGPLWDAVYAQLTRGAEAGKLSMADPEVKAIAVQLSDALEAPDATGSDSTRAGWTRHACTLAAIATTLRLLCVDNEHTRQEFGESLTHLLSVSGMPLSTQLEFIYEA